MKNKGRLILVFFIIILGVLLFACYKKENNELNENSSNSNIVQEVNGNEIIVKDTDNKYIAKLLANNDNLKENKYKKENIQATIVDSSDLGISLYIEIKADLKTNIDELKNKSIKEYVWNNYKGFLYEDSESVKFVIVLDEQGDESIALYGNVSVSNIDNHDINVKEAFDKEEIQDLLNTVEYKK